MLSGLTGVSTPTLRKLYRHVHRGEVACPLTIVGLTAVGLQEPAEPLLAMLRGRDEATVRAVLGAVLAERVRQQELEEALDRAHEEARRAADP